MPIILKQSKKKQIIICKILTCQRQQSYAHAWSAIQHLVWHLLLICSLSIDGKKYRQGGGEQNQNVLITVCK